MSQTSIPTPGPISDPTSSGPTPGPIPLIIVTGFLGAGKTSFLNRLLKNAAFQNTAVVVNEFGDIALDHLLMEQSDDGIIEIGGGCLCCTVRGELVDTLALLAARRPAPHRLIIETSGLAEPVALLQAILGHPVLANRYRVDSVIALIDAINGLSTLRDFETAREQVAVADRIIITKTDLSGSDGMEALSEPLARLNPTAQILESKDTLLFEALLQPGFSAKLLHQHEHEHHHHHEHEHDAFQSLSLDYPGILPVRTLENFLDLIISQCGESILRIKGLAEVSHNPEQPLIIQGTRNLLHKFERLAAWPDDVRGTRLVIIGEQLDHAYIERLFFAFTNMVSVDQPDRTALENNPLAIPGMKF